MTDEHLSYGINFNSRDDFYMNVGLYGGSRGVNEGQRTTWRPRTFTSVEKMAYPCQIGALRQE
jgi:hypothetical protein